MNIEGETPLTAQELDKMETKINLDLECDDPNLSYLSDFLKEMKTFIESKKFDDGFSNRITNPSKCLTPAVNATNKEFVQ